MTKNSAIHRKEEVLCEFRVREILDAACRVVAQHGFQGATMDRVAEEAKIAKGTMYLYFHNKDELLKAAVEQGNGTGGTGVTGGRSRERGQTGTGHLHSGTG